MFFSTLVYSLAVASSKPSVSQEIQYHQYSSKNVLLSCKIRAIPV